MLPLKKIYIDSRFKTDDSISHTDFQYDLGKSVFMPEHTSYYMDDVNIPNSWYSIEKGMNSKMFFRYKLVMDAVGERDVLIDIPSDIYNGDSFRTIIDVTLNAATAAGDGMAHTFTVVYEENRNRISITSTYVEYFKILTDIELRNPSTNWGYNNAHAGIPLVAKPGINQLGSMNEVIKNYGTSGTYNQYNIYYSGYLDFLRYNNIYVSSNIGEYQTLGPRGQQTIIRKVPVTAGSGFVVNDRVVGKHDILSCSKAALRMLNFRFHDAWGQTINLNGCHVSFSLVFTSIVEDR